MTKRAIHGLAAVAAGVVLCAASGATFAQGSLTLPTPAPTVSVPNVTATTVPMFVVPLPPMTPPPQALFAPPELPNDPVEGMVPGRPDADQVLGSIGDPMARGSGRQDRAGIGAIANTDGRDMSLTDGDSLLGEAYRALGQEGAPADTSSDFSAGSAQEFLQGNADRNEANRPTGADSSRVSGEVSHARSGFKDLTAKELDNQADRSLIHASEFSAAAFVEERKADKAYESGDHEAAQEHATNAFYLRKGEEKWKERAKEERQAAQEKALVEQEENRTEIEAAKAKTETSDPSMPNPEGDGTENVDIPDELRLGPQPKGGKGGDVDPTPEGGPVTAKLEAKKPLSEDEVKALADQRQGGLINPGGGDAEAKGGNEEADALLEAAGGPDQPGFGATIDPTGTGEGTDPVAGEKGGEEGFTGLE